MKRRLIYEVRVGVSLDERKCDTPDFLAFVNCDDLDEFIGNLAQARIETGGIPTIKYGDETNETLGLKVEILRVTGEQL